MGCIVTQLTRTGGDANSIRVARERSAFGDLITRKSSCLVKFERGFRMGRPMKSKIYFDRPLRGLTAIFHRSSASLSADCRERAKRCGRRFVSSLGTLLDRNLMQACFSFQRRWNLPNRTWWEATYQNGRFHLGAEHGYTMKSFPDSVVCHESL